MADHNPASPAVGEPETTVNPPAKAWSGRFSEPVSDLVKRYTASVFFDNRMAAQDIRGSIAHARMLARQGIIGAQDLAEIERGMATISAEIERGEFAWNLDDEDVHLNIEKRLTALVGDAGKRLHTGRSRNDQVATDIRLWLRDAIDTIVGLIRDFQLALLDLAEHHADTVEYAHADDHADRDDQPDGDARRGRTGANGAGDDAGGLYLRL